MVTMGNLFSGSGTWELAAQICGMEVKFEAEIEKFPVAVEEKRFPNAIQLGDVSKIGGRDIPIVDFICNSSPCQDLSVAGKRAGLAGERSGLFDQAIRITKEMREHDEGNKKIWMTSKSYYMTSWTTDVAFPLLASDYKDAPIIVTKKNTSSGD